jgi:hypothetical protein
VGPNESIKRGQIKLTNAPKGALWVPSDSKKA